MIRVRLMNDVIYTHIYPILSVRAVTFFDLCLPVGLFFLFLFSSEMKCSNLKYDIFSRNQCIYM